MTQMSIEAQAVAGGGPDAVTNCPDGALWFTMVHSGQIGWPAPGGNQATTSSSRARSRRWPTRPPGARRLPHRPGSHEVVSSAGWLMSALRRRAAGRCFTEPGGRPMTRLNAREKGGLGSVSEPVSQFGGGGPFPLRWTIEHEGRFSGHGLAPCRLLRMDAVLARRYDFHATLDDLVYRWRLRYAGPLWRNTDGLFRGAHGTPVGRKPRHPRLDGWAR